MTFTVLIPARLASTRLPDKPLADICGVPMVVRVAQQALKSKATRVVVAADSSRIVDRCNAFDIEALMTRQDHLSGSDRLAEACSSLRLADDEIVVNVQGDEPLIAPELIDAVAGLLLKRPDCEVATAAHGIGSMKDFLNPNVVKVVLDASNTALYFSRSPIPASRDAVDEAWWSEGRFPPPLRHIGIYAYRVAFLHKFPKLPAAPIEQLESLEQLRALWHGHRIAVHVSDDEPAAGVDTPDDLERTRALFSR